MTRRNPAEYDWDTVSFDETVISEIDGYPRRTTSPRRERIQFIVVHHMAMVGTGNGKAADSCIHTWRSREASAHYCVDGAYVRQTVWDGDEAWATANSHGNRAGISIEHANSTASPKWLVSDQTVKTGARLVAHLCKAYGLGRPEIGKNLFRHRDFYSTACPGPFLGGSHWHEYEAEAQRAYDAIGSVPVSSEPTTPTSEAPMTVIELEKFKATLPVDKDGNGSPDERFPITGDALPYMDITYDDHHRPIKVSMIAPVDGATTSGTKNVRMELREMAGKLKAAWDSRKTKHIMLAAFTVHEIPKKLKAGQEYEPGVVVAQIHDSGPQLDGKDSDDVVMIRVDALGVWAELSHGKGLGGERVLLDSDYLIGQRFYLQISANRGGITVVYRRSGSQKNVVVPFEKAGAGWYWKAGPYCQGNKTNAKGRAHVDINELRLIAA